MNWLARILSAVPCLPAPGGWFTNRRNPPSKLCSITDVSRNFTDKLMPFLNKDPKPRKGFVIRDSEGRYSGSIDRTP